MPLKRWCPVSTLLPRWAASRLSEAASRYGLSAADVAGAALEATAAHLGDVERVMNVYGCCDVDAWRLAVSALYQGGAAAYELAEPVVKALHGEGVLVIMGLSWLDGMRGVSLRFASLDPWLDYVDVRVEAGRVRADYIFILGTSSTTPDYDDVLEAVESRLAGGARLEKGEEARLVYSVDADTVESLQPVEDVASLYADILREAGVEWLVAEVEHGYSPERHADLARRYYQLGSEAENPNDAAFDLLRSLEETLKMLVKRHELVDIIEDARKSGWSTSHLEEAVERLTGIYPVLPAAWSKALDVTLALQENRLTHEDVGELRDRLETVLRKTGVL